MLVFVGYLSRDKQSLPYLIRRGTCLQSRLVVQQMVSVAILTPSEFMPQPMLDILR
ncbi:hypothetical protein [Vibrio viridaestus]|uniref:hypothetical protein n=1 Tax=Vibrio viridaestus TaxID=2487322 RepID=UPI00140BB39D|nr:hypothetical protein [Vibrio viridaestus]